MDIKDIKIGMKVRLLGKHGVGKNYDNIEKIIDAYLVVKHECQHKDFMERHDFISLVIEKTKQI